MRRILLIIVASALLVSCAGADDPDSGAGAADSPGDDLAAGSDPVQPVGGDLRLGEPWYFVGGMLDTASPPEAPVTLTFKRARALGQDSANTYSAPYTTGESGALAFGAWESTHVGSSAPEQQIQAYLREVDGFTTVQMGELYLFDGDLNVLVYAVEPPSDEPTIDDETQAVALEVIGMSEAEAQRTVQEAGLTFRLVSRDGTALMVTEDYSVTRINATVVDDEVTESTIG
jgi:hypothetical protein